MDNRGLAMETAAIKNGSRGLQAVSRQIGSVKITDVTISAEAQLHAGRTPGRYITLECEPDAQGLTALLGRGMSQLLPMHGRLLAVGLGNPDITHDSLGAAVVRTLAVRSGRRYSLYAIETDVAARTGIDTARLVKAVAREIHADCIIAIDALSCATPARIGKTVQVTNSGIIPGSATVENRLPLTSKALGIPIVAIGVPTITPTDKHFHITVPDIDIVVKMWAESIAGAVDNLLG